LKVVIIGGGTGLSVVLKGLKKYTEEITAVVTVFDDGGGSGVLREDLGMLPPGDIRACLIALSDQGSYLEQLFNYRFCKGNLKGQSLGNLMIAAAQGLSNDFREAVLKVGEIIAINGQVLPVTLEDIHLRAHLNNGDVILGESRIPKRVMEKKTGINKIVLDPLAPEPTEGVLEAIESADVILLGPGSLYTSVIPNLLVKGVAEAVKNSSAWKVYVSNLMTQPGETHGYSVVDHLASLEKHAGDQIVDCIFVNDMSLPEKIRERYRQEGSEQIILTQTDIEVLKSKEIEIVHGDVVEIIKDYCRHDAEKLCKIIFARF
jgi:uncharacterized cofD-like protein